MTILRTDRQFAFVPGRSPEGGSVEKPALLKMTCIFFLFCAATAIASPAEIFSSLANFDDAHGASPQYMSLLQVQTGTCTGPQVVEGSTEVARSSESPRAVR